MLAPRRTVQLAFRKLRKKFSVDSVTPGFNGDEYGYFALEVFTMSTRSVTAKMRWLRALSVIVVLLSISLTAQSNSATGELRSSLTRHANGSLGDAQGEHGATVDSYIPLLVEGQRGRNTQVHSVSKSTPPVARQHSVLFDFWIYEADVVLFSDDDNDGYFYGIDLLLDADTLYRSAEVYAAVYLSLEGGPWNEYAVTEDFTIHGESANDEYVLVTELMSGYPTGSYDLLIELFDAFDGSFLAALGPEDTSALSALPLEDFNRDAPAFDQPVTFSRGSGGGGAAGAGSLIVLMVTLLGRAARRRNS
jgi:hypothetical protein